MRPSSIAFGPALVLLLASCSSGDAPSLDPAPAALEELDPPRAEPAAPRDDDTEHPSAPALGAGDTTRDDASDACASLPPRDCTGTAAYCGKIVPFEPVTGPGYDNYPLNGETATNQYRSFARVDLVMLIKWATAFTACKSASWTEGNGGPLGLGDMSEADGSIPGTSIGSPGHPAGTHVNGYDMDIAYFQTGTADNKLRAVCPHHTNGVDQYHCTGAPTKLDVDRTALFLGALLSSNRVRVIGVDGKIGPLVKSAVQDLCADGVVPAAGCSRTGLLAWEETNTGRGWYRFHHHHLHVSLNRVATTWARSAEPAEGLELHLVPARGPASVLDTFLDRAQDVAGHGRTLL